MDQDKLQDARIQIVALDVRVTELENALSDTLRLLNEAVKLQRVFMEKVLDNGNS